MKKIRSFALLTIMTAVCTAALPDSAGAQIPDSVEVIPASRLRVIERRVQQLATTIARDLDSRPWAALKRITPGRRRFLALRAYLRRDSLIATNWTWDAREIRAYKQSEEYQEAMDVIAKVTRMFEEMNPGYSLSVNTGVRPLGHQISLWNGARSIARAGDELMLQVCRLFTDSTAWNLPDSEAADLVRSFLKGYELIETTTVAPPGLSHHGQLRAYDFLIRRGGRIIAGASTSSIPDVWDEPGWSGRLRLAITQSTGRLVGPLTEPYEPWHYTWVP